MPPQVSVEAMQLLNYSGLLSNKVANNSGL